MFLILYMSNLSFVWAVEGKKFSDKTKKSNSFESKNVTLVPKL